MTEAKARALFLKRFDALIEMMKTSPDPVVRVGAKDWHWIEPLTQTVDGTIRYQGVEILVLNGD